MAFSIFQTGFAFSRKSPAKKKNQVIYGKRDRNISIEKELTLCHNCGRAAPVISRIDFYFRLIRLTYPYLA